MPVISTTDHRPGNGKLKVAPTQTAQPAFTSNRNKVKIKRKDNRRLKSSASWLLDNQIGISFNLIALLLFVHLFVPRARHTTSKLFLPSHYNPNTEKYAIGDGDFYFLAFYVVLFTGLRAGFMEYILAPLATQWGITKKKDITRFSEQAWLLCYYSVFWTLGLYIYCTSKYFLNLPEMFTDWPTRELPGLTKAYILGQWAFWLQQILVINIEERRKDHWQMLAHHLVTVVLISTSYALHLTRVANLVLILMDVVDIFFPLAKCLKYLGYTTARDILFGVFMLSWFLARHVCYLITMWSIWKHMPETIAVGCYHGSQDSLRGPTPLPSDGDWSHAWAPFHDPAGTICYSNGVRWGFLGALGFLQVLTVLWFVLIVQVAVRVVKGIGADDIRSDDEAEQEAAEEEDELVPVTEYKICNEIGVAALGGSGWARRTGGTRRTASSSGVSLTGHFDRKELLSRIGCEKQ
ncbi:longevity assurance proteins LAG1/LAC1 [Aspergillus homomorphus CBS 101889]|uniref:Longevity assurance proteins LAG1/LAC1 n=1 Tax=Aspergillus homomorphus (strain CBS 101889) TaxID=1450537 RepID=A0A395HUE8_ASPHC|nr:longevity assurance proteins LAG1/LAC1 [Aspergillus homomorphus CBS 101889]RAL10458.1 longevity assurance proteins LAG1/LAC1 [Aspergillus homomorphus CBS 101889]